MKYVVMCKTGAEKKWWVVKPFETMAEAKKRAARERATDKEYHHTGYWIYKIEEMTEQELFESY